MKSHFHLFTGGLPYPGIQNHELPKYLLAGNRLEKPDICSDELYELMCHCWKERREDRPNFSDICERLDPKKNRIYIDFTELSIVFPPTCAPGCSQ